MISKTKIHIIGLSLLFMIVIGYVNNHKHQNISLKNDIAVENSAEADENLTPSEIIRKIQEENNNTDIIGVLKIENTDYQTIVPKGTDNNFYLRHLPNKKYAHNGSTFMDSRIDLEDGRKLLIYGHNSSKYNMPFKILENYYDENYYQNHKYLELITMDGIKYYKIFSVYVETSDFAYYQKIEFKDDDTWYSHILNLKSKSFYETNVDISKDDNILILQTCSTLGKYKKYEKKYMLVISKEVLKDEIN